MEVKTQMTFAILGRTSIGLLDFTKRLQKWTKPSVRTCPVVVEEASILLPVAELLKSGARTCLSWSMMPITVPL